MPFLVRNASRKFKLLISKGVSAVNGGAMKNGVYVGICIFPTIFAHLVSEQNHK